MSKLYQISFYVPVTHCEIVKASMFEAGAGRVGDYQECAWQTLGEGQFKSLSSSQPFIGEIGELEKVTEYKVEMVCVKGILNQVIQALKSSHPYEVPAYHVIKLEAY